MATNKGKIRYAVVGLGHIAQIAVLPAFRNAAKNSVLAALVSGDPQKLKELGREYKTPATYSYDQYEDCLRSGQIDAVFIALPNDMHREYAVRAAKAGIHVLCEKPLGITEKDCRQMIDAAARHRVKLMTAYRLHHEEANLRAAEIAQSGKLGDLRLFNSVFCMQVAPGNTRVKKLHGGGPLYDIGVYCVNAARNLFRAEPTEVFAFAATGSDERFREIEETVSAILRFPGERLASFACSFGAAAVAEYEIVGTKGSLRLSPAYLFAGELAWKLTVGGKSQEKVFPKRDQFAAEIAHFSDCILQDKEPESSGLEGLADVRIVEAILKSARTGKPVTLQPIPDKPRPHLGQELRFPAVKNPKLVNVTAPNRE